jgi:hypothetical protein
MNKFSHPLDEVERTIKEARRMMKKTYSLEMMQALAEHNMDGLVPALRAALAWAKKIEKDARHLEAKRDRAMRKRGK